MSEQREKKLAIATHAFESVDFDVYYNHMFCATQWAKNHSFIYLGLKGLQAADARNRIVKKALDAECDYIFFLDADHYISPNTLELLMEHADNCAMVSGLICKRGGDFEQVGFYRTKDGLFAAIDLPLDGRTYEVDVCAFGCTLINLQKLKELEEPYFRDTCGPVADGSIHNLRSDINICTAFRDKGERILIDTRVLVGHKGIPKVIYPQNSAYYRRQREEVDDAVQLKVDERGDYMRPEEI